jgi:hypothetical protein
MTREPSLSREQLDRVRAAAAVLMPGATDSPALDHLPNFDELLQRAAAALAGEGRALGDAIAVLPDEPSWAALSALADRNPEAFELVSLLAVGAYFMSPAVLTALGRPTGKRRAADPEQVVDELSNGLLDPVFARGCPVRTLDEVNGAVHAR